jgi:hypothetical protein
MASIFRGAHFVHKQRRQSAGHYGTARVRKWQRNWLGHPFRASESEECAATQRISRCLNSYDFVIRACRWWLFNMSSTSVAYVVNLWYYVATLFERANWHLSWANQTASFTSAYANAVDTRRIKRLLWPQRCQCLELSFRGVTNVRGLWLPDTRDYTLRVHHSSQQAKPPSSRPLSSLVSQWLLCRLS